MKKILGFYILYRLPIIIVLIGLGVWAHWAGDLISAWICYVLAFISLLLYFGIGTMRLVQEAVTDGDVDLAMLYLKKIPFPRLLFKPVRAGYYMLQSNFLMVNDDLGKAEENIRKSLNTKSKIVGDVKGESLLQLGFIQLKKGDSKQARITLMEAIKSGIKDKEGLAAAHLQLCSIEIQRNQNKVAKQHFQKAKSLKPKTEEIVKQIKQMDKSISRLPG